MLIYSVSTNQEVDLFLGGLPWDIMTVLLAGIVNSQMTRSAGGSQVVVGIWLEQEMSTALLRPPDTGFRSRASIFLPPTAREKHKSRVKDIQKSSCIYFTPFRQWTWDFEQDKIFQKAAFPFIFPYLDSKQSERDQEPDSSKNAH